jgi:hypothetical protein
MVKQETEACELAVKRIIDAAKQMVRAYNILAIEVIKTNDVMKNYCDTIQKLEAENGKTFRKNKNILGMS